MEDEMVDTESSELDNQDDLTNDEPASIEEGGGQGEQQAQAKVPYTAEEMAALDFDQIDTSRIPAEHQPFYKAMQRSFTQATMGLAEARKNFMQQPQPQSPAPAPASSDPKEQAFAQFSQNPGKVRLGIRQDINNLRKQANAMFVEYKNAEAVGFNQQADYLEGVLAEFESRYQDLSNMHTSALNQSNRAQMELERTIPNFSQVSVPMSEFVTKSGVDQRLISNILTNAPVLDVVLKNMGIYDIDGVAAVRQIAKFVYGQYEKSVAGQTAEGKVNRTASRAITPGTGSAAPTQGAKRVAVDQQTDYEKARKSGDWEAYFQKYHSEI